MAVLLGGRRTIRAKEKSAAVWAGSQISRSDDQVEGWAIVPQRGGSRPGGLAVLTGPPLPDARSKSSLGTCFPSGGPRFAVFKRLEGMLSSSPAGGFPNDQFGLDGDLARLQLLGLNAFKKSLGGDSAHPDQGLAHGGQAGGVVGRDLNVVEAHHRDIAGNAQALFLKGPDRADRG